MKPLEILSLSKHYGSLHAVEDLSFSVEPGEIFGYLGPNGSGKTTTIRCVLGFMKPTSGEIRLFCETVRHGRGTQHDRIGYLPGDFKMWPDLTARKALDMLGTLSGRKISLERRNALAERLELDMNRRFRDLSKGNRQKIGILMAFQGEPDLLVLDEPTTGLDPLVRQVVLELVREAAANGATVLLSSHDLAEVSAVCNRAAILRKGHLVELATIAEILSQTEYKMRVWFGQEVPVLPADHFPQIKVVKQESMFLELVCLGSPHEVLKWVMQYPVERLTTPEPTLEEAFMVYYHDQGNGNDKPKGEKR